MTTLLLDHSELSIANARPLASSLRPSQSCFSSWMNPLPALTSQSARAIISCLRTLADNGQAILCTIHQPSAELFQAFDRLLLLRKGGQTVYFGDLGHNSTTVIHYFEENGSRKCDADENPAEFMLDVIGAGATGTSEIDWHTIWRHSHKQLKPSGRSRRCTGEISTVPLLQQNDTASLLHRGVSRPLS